MTEKELKTLKDIEGFFQISDGETEGKYKIVISDDLKQEAIKHVKHFQEAKEKAIFQNQLLDENNLCEEYFKKGRMFDEKIEDWKHFFNITEEDLR